MDSRLYKTWFFTRFRAFCVLGFAIWTAWCLLFYILGIHFDTSGAPRETILAPRDHPGGPWVQQDGLGVVNSRISVDLGFWGLFMSVFGVQNIKEGFLTRAFRMESIATIDFSWKSFVMNFGIEFYCFSDVLGAVVLFLCLETDLNFGSRVMFPPPACDSMYGLSRHCPR